MNVDKCIYVNKSLNVHVPQYYCNIFEHIRFIIKLSIINWLHWLDEPVLHSAIHNKLQLRSTGNWKDTRVSASPARTIYLMNSHNTQSA